MTRSFDLCSPSDSVANTTKAALKNAVQQATLLGTPDTPTTTAAAKKSSRAVPLGAGLGVGLGVPLIAAVAAHFLWWKPAHAGASGLAAPML